jgi:hypothetical protein
LHDFVNRLEGTRRFPVAAAPVIELIGFQAFRAPFRPDDDVDLNVAFFVPTNSSHVRLTAREYVRNEFYWMEAKPRPWTRGWNVFAPWPVRDALRRHRIGDSNLVVLARLDGYRTGGGSVTPVFVRTSTDGVAATEYRAFFVTGKRLSAVRYTLTSLAPSAIVRQGRFGAKPGLTPFTIVIPVQGLAAGPMRLTVTCDVADEVPPTSEFAFDFYHQPSVPHS